jgi:thiol-disulfide isomerase/thioredoxin
MKNFTSAVICAVFVFLLGAAVPGGAMDKTDKDKILAYENWKEVYTGYRVDESFIDTLKAKAGDNLKIDVYLAFWCGDSKRNLPPFLKIIETIDNPKVQVNYYTVKRKPNKETKYFVADLKVERVPTFIFYRDGKEIGRIIENPKNSLEEDFLEIIF